MGTPTQEVDLYLQGLDPERRVSLAKLRALVLETVPRAAETMKYRMPTYQHQDDVLCAFASQKRYMSLYMDTAVVEKHREEFKHLSVGKGCIRFKTIQQLPLDTIKRMLSETVETWESA